LDAKAPMLEALYEEESAMYLRVTFTVCMVFLLSSCTSLKSHPESYRYVDAAGVFILNAQTAVEHDTRFLEFAEYGAFSESIYLDDNPAKSVKSLDAFCADEETLYRPVEWQKIEDLRALNERIEAHSDLTLEIQLFTKNQGGKTNVLIVFRGTDFDQSEDWTSNFRWFNRFFSSQLDQYDEVRILTPLLIGEIEERVEEIGEIVAVGHSLGGGLAQLAGYSSHKIDTVFAFDSSPVTGFYDVEGGLRRFNSHGLKVYRIYEHGEVLAYVRLGMKGIYSVSKENPKIVQIRFDLITDENPVGQHNIRELTCKLNKEKIQ
jgi:hypothetical protein